MTGTRLLTKNLGLIAGEPPDAIVGRAGKLVERLGPRGRGVGSEPAHWGYGAAGGAAFGLIPERLRRHAWAGAATASGRGGLFEAALAPLFGVQYVCEQGEAAQAALVAAQLLYGVVAGQLAPEPARGQRRLQTAR